MKTLRIVYLKDERVVLSSGHGADELVDDVAVRCQKVGGFGRQIRCVVKIILQSEKARLNNIDDLANGLKQFSPIPKYNFLI